MSETGIVTETHRRPELEQIYVTVEKGPSQIEQVLPFLPIRKDWFTPPREGDEVEIFKIDDSGTKAARRPKWPLETRAGNTHRGQMAEEDKVQMPEDLQEDDWYEGYGPGTEIYVRREMDGGEEVRSIHIRCSGDFVVEAGGEYIENTGVDTKNTDPEYFPEDRSDGDFPSNG